MKIDHIFIVHYEPLTQRRQYLTNCLHANNISNYEFFTEYSRDTTPKEIMDKYYTVGELTPAQICIGIAHLEIYKKILERDYKYTLILEDDALLDFDFSIKLDEYLKTLPQDFEVAYLNNGCSQHVRHANNKDVWYRMNEGRTLCGYIVTQEFCKKLLKSSIPYTEVIDWEVNTQVKKQNLISYWAEPPIIKDGSAIIYGSSYVRFIDLPK
jgi:GR25 family glycosyltransferase involved in LPS biosynthesis